MTWHVSLATGTRLTWAVTCTMTSPGRLAISNDATSSRSAPLSSVGCTCRQCASRGINSAAHLSQHVCQHTPLCIVLTAVEVSWHPDRRDILQGYGACTHDPDRNGNEGCGICVPHLSATDLQEAGGSGQLRRQHQELGRLSTPWCALPRAVHRPQLRTALWHKSRGQSQQHTQEMEGNVEVAPSSRVPVHAVGGACAGGRSQKGTVRQAVCSVKGSLKMPNSTPARPTRPEPGLSTRRPCRPRAGCRLALHHSTMPAAARRCLRLVCEEHSVSTVLPNPKRVSADPAHRLDSWPQAQQLSAHSVHSLEELCRPAGCSNVSWSLIGARFSMVCGASTCTRLEKAVGVSALQWNIWQPICSACLK